MDATLPGAGSSVTAIAGTSSSMPGTAAFTHARPCAPTLNVAPLMDEAPSRMNHSRY
jgi:hypothetical protein